MILLFVFFVVSCSVKDDPILVNIVPGANSQDAPQTKTAQTSMTCDYTVTPEMVLEYLYSLGEEQSKTVSFSSYPEEGLPCLYVVNFEKGFKVFPGDSRFGVVLIEEEDDDLYLTENIENKGFKLWIDDLAIKIEKARGDSRIDSFGEESTRFWDNFRHPSLTKDMMKILDKSIKGGAYSNDDLWVKIKYCNSSNTTILAERGHLLPTKWGQSSPWNVSMGTTNGAQWLTGCAAVAVSQVLYYFNSFCNSPTGLYHTVSIANSYDFYHDSSLFKNITLNRDNFTLNSPRWADMPLDSLSSNTSGYSYVSDLMLDVGERLNMYYSPALSMVFLTNGFFDIGPCKLNYAWSGYSSSSVSGVMNSLSQYSPVIITATGPFGGMGHTWVIDGYETIRLVTFEKYMWIPYGTEPSGFTVYDTKTTSELISLYGYFYPGMIVEENHQASTSTYFKMNWGYDGDRDSYLYLINPNEMWENYYYYKYVHYNITPLEFNL